jgi:hypothetical protein
VNRTATTSWPTEETDPQRVGILAAADRMLSGKPKRCSGNLSVSQLAVEANVKYWVVAQKHTDLRDHFQRLAVAARRAATARDDDNDPIVKLRRKNAGLTDHCRSLERLVQKTNNYSKPEPPTATSPRYTAGGPPTGDSFRA